MTKSLVIAAGSASVLGLAWWLWFSSSPEQQAGVPRPELSATLPAPGAQSSRDNGNEVPAARAAAPTARNSEEPTIDVPAAPLPPFAGDDRSHSGLPVALFDKRAELQTRGPSEERWSAVAARMHHEIPPETRKRVMDSFRKR